MKINKNTRIDIMTSQSATSGVTGTVEKLYPKIQQGGENRS